MKPLSDKQICGHHLFPQRKEQKLIVSQCLMALELLSLPWSAHRTMPHSGETTDRRVTPKEVEATEREVCGYRKCEGVGHFSK